MEHEWQYNSKPIRHRQVLAKVRDLRTNQTRITRAHRDKDTGEWVHGCYPPHLYEVIAWRIPDYE